MPDLTIAMPGPRAIAAYAQADLLATTASRGAPCSRHHQRGDPLPTVHDDPQGLRWGTAQTREMLREGLAAD